MEASRWKHHIAYAGINCPWWVGAVLLLACVAFFVRFAGLHQPYIESCDVVQQNMPLLKNKNGRLSKYACGVDSESSDEDEEDEIEEGRSKEARKKRKYRRRGKATEDTHLLEKHDNGSTHSSVATAAAQEQQEKYDIVTITADGPKVLSLQGGAVPLGIPVALQPYDLITVPPQDEVPPSSPHGGWGCSMHQEPYNPQLGQFSASPATSQHSLRRPSEDFDVVTITPQGVNVQPVEGNVPAGIPVVQIDNPRPSPLNYMPRHIPQGQVLRRH